MDPIGSEEGEEPPAGRQVQLHLDRFCIGAPAGRRQGRRVGQPTDGLHFDSPGAEFDTDGPVLGIAGDELTFATTAHGSQLLALGRIETPDLLHLTGNTVLEGQALSAFVQPHLPHDAQACGLLGSHAAHAFHQFDGRGNIPAVHREPLPGFGKIALRRINGRGSDDLHDSEFRPGSECDQLVGHGLPGPAGKLDFPGIVQTEGIEAEGPRAGPHLGFGVS